MDRTVAADVSIRTTGRVLAGFDLSLYMSAAPSWRGGGGEPFARIDVRDGAYVLYTTDAMVIGEVGHGASDKDVVVQMDAFDGRATFWAWPAGQPMPVESPLIWWNVPVARYLGMGVVAGVSNQLTDVDEVAGVFRYVRVDTQPIRDLAGDFDSDTLLTDRDIDVLAVEMTSAEPRTWFDLNADELISFDDVRYWVHDLRRTWFGDANLDGEFNSGDLITALAAGTYETDVDAGWASGDFDGSGRFESGDLIFALADGGYEAGPRPAAVPEPVGLTTMLLGLMTATIVSRSRQQLA